MHDPDDDFDSDDYSDPFQEIREELSDFNDSWAASNDEGWFYRDED